MHVVGHEVSNFEKIPKLKLLKLQVQQRILMHVTENSRVSGQWFPNS